VSALEVTRDEILAELATVFEEELALGSWGRLLVEVARNPAGALRVADVVVEEIVGDEAEVERCFESRAAGEVMQGMPVVLEALFALEADAELDRLGGGTFVRVDTDGRHAIAFLPGLVRAPSVAFDRARDDVLRTAAERDLTEKYGLARTKVETDMESGELAFLRDGETVARGEQVVLGSFEKRARSWVWAAHNPSLVERARERARALLDAMPDRSAWEISTPGLVTDEATSWALAWWVALQSGLEGVVRVSTRDGYVALGVSRLVPTTVTR
jgi:hypothetical protein